MWHRLHLAAAGRMTSTYAVWLETLALDERRESVSRNDKIKHLRYTQGHPSRLTKRSSPRQTVSSRKILHASQSKRLFDPTEIIVPKVRLKAPLLLLQSYGSRVGDARDGPTNISLLRLFGVGNGSRALRFACTTLPIHLKHRV